ncbi:hypothetical protein [Alicyclobacillus shizuokensis]|uniref:hypothetical protein n=1 Tax=Alicyclobacillus shizuokensis TaxID=392014 RepID=UPI00083614E4|nr:hypothetical protein [Alicyclobacillus shizuokensis]MCL6625294.1 hypothetical protein [Alicyclobacillus shizuokensis]
MNSLPANTGSSKRHQWRTRAWILAMAGIITGLVLTLIPVMHHIAAAREAAHQHTFMEYVTVHHLGTLTVIDSGTGLDPVSYVLTVRRPVSVNDREALLTRLMKKYYEYDKGELLSVVYRSPTGQDQPIGSAHYDDSTGRLQLTINLDSGGTRVVNRDEHW